MPKRENSNLKIQGISNGINSGAKFDNLRSVSPTFYTPGTSVIESKYNGQGRPVAQKVTQKGSSMKNFNLSSNPQKVRIVKRIIRSPVRTNHISNKYIKTVSYHQITLIESQTDPSNRK